MSSVTFSAVYLPLLLAGLALLICIFSFFFCKAYVKRRTSKEWLLQEGILTEIKDEVNALLKSIDETTDRDITLITEREKKLRALLGEADKRIKVYIREMDKRPGAEETYAALLAANPEGNLRLPGPAEEKPDSDLPEPSANDGTYVDLGKLRYRLKKQETAEVPAGEPKPALEFSTGPQLRIKGTEVPGTPKADPKAEIPSVNNQVYSMLKAGFSEAAIASRLGLSITEVEFTAALLERRKDQQMERINE